jgi:hypothetical protein
MPEFLVEAYVSRCAVASGKQRADDVAAVAERMTEEGRFVRLRRWILVPDEETGFYLFHAHTEETVREAATRGGLRFERVLEAVSDWTERQTGEAHATSTSAGALAEAREDPSGHRGPRTRANLAGY